MSDDGGIDAEIDKRIQAGWRNWRKLSGVPCDRRLSARRKGKIFKTAVRPAMTDGSETWAIKKSQERKMDVAEMRMLRWACGVTKMDRITNQEIRNRTKVTEVHKKIQEKRLRWFGHVSRREESHITRRILEMEVEGRRRPGRPSRRWMDGVREDMQERRLSVTDTADRQRWNVLTRNGDPT